MALPNIYQLIREARNPVQPIQEIIAVYNNIQQTLTEAEKEELEGSVSDAGKFLSILQGILDRAEEKKSTIASSVSNIASNMQQGMKAVDTISGTEYVKAHNLARQFSDFAKRNAAGKYNR